MSIKAGYVRRESVARTWEILENSSGGAEIQEGAHSIARGKV
jgi:hypothetical protein